MAELPEREQAHRTFDTLHMLAKKLEAENWHVRTGIPPAQRHTQ